MSDLEIEEAIRIAADGDAVLFLGAGIGGKVYSATGTIPDGKTLANRLLERADDAPNPPLLDRASGYVLREGRGSDYLYSKLIENLIAERVEVGLSSVLGLPWRRIYTTNYDNAVELARNVKSLRASKVPEDDVSNIQRGDIVHINGYIKRVNPSNLASNLSLTDVSYADRRFESSPWYRVFRTDIVAARAIIFVGYSLYDLDITRALVDSEISGKTFFYLSPTVDPIDLSSISEYGTLCEGGVDGLIDAQERALVGYEPNKADAAFLSLRKLTIDPITDYNSVDLLDKQLIFGSLPEKEVLAGLGPFDHSRFVIDRDQERAALDAIRRGLARDILVVGEIASGKSATALSLSAHFLREGYEVFVLTRGASLMEEMRTLATFDRNIILVIEGYGDFREEIYEYVKSRPGGHRLIMTEQAVAHQFTENFIYSEVFDNRVFEVVLDTILPADVDKFVELVNFAGLWGDRSGSSTSSLSNFLLGNLEGSLYRLLLEIIESEHVRRRIAKLLEPLFFDSFATRIFIAACVTNRIGIAFNPSDWAGLFDPARARRVMANHRASLENFLNMSGARVFGRTGLMSFKILRQVPDHQLVLSTVVDLFRAASRSSGGEEFYEEIVLDLTKFNTIEPILGFDKTGELILKYYDEIRPIGEVRNNPDYWLQYGIAATALDRLDRAGDAFKNAYAREKKKRRPNTKKIDNYFSRFQLKQAASLDNSEDAFTLFVSATSLISKQIFMDDNRHYPFKSGRVYAEIATRHFDRWTDDYQEHFIRETTAIRDKAIDFKSRSKVPSVDVDILIAETSDLLKRLAAKKPTS